MQLETEVCGGKSCRWTKLDLICTVLCLGAFAISIIVVFAVTPTPKICEYVTMVPRDVWDARAQESEAKKPSPVQVVFIHHTGGNVCSTNPTCKGEMNKMMTEHINQGLQDIGYSFAVGENGWVYEARGWGNPTEHIPNWDDKAVSIVIIGSFNNTVPNKWAMDAAETLIKCGVESGHISAEYKLVTRQDQNSKLDAGPGKMLYEKLKEWTNYAVSP